MTRRDDRPSGYRPDDKAINPELRSPFEQDVDRIYYNYYFRRLSDVTQVSSGHGKILQHNRMTHSIKVAQVGRRLVQYLEHEPANKCGIAAAGGIDRNVVTAAGLLHDIGHPPYGHIAEEQLDDLAKRNQLKDGFEGNAQTLRIIASLTAHQRGDSHLAGLDLTCAVIAACVKYPYSRGGPDSRKWGYYDTEEDFFKEYVEPFLPGFGKPNLEAQIMDWADDITYAVHDLQDYFTDGVIPLHYLTHQRGLDGKTLHAVNQVEFNDFWQYATEKLRNAPGMPQLEEARKILEEFTEIFPRQQYGGTRAELAEAGKLASIIITEASKDTYVRNDGTLYVKPRMRVVINALKQVTWYYVIDRPSLVTKQLGQRARVVDMFKKLYLQVEYCFDPKRGPGLGVEQFALRQRRLPVQLREFAKSVLGDKSGQPMYPDLPQCFARAVLDFIASMTEIDFEDMWHDLCNGHG